MLDRGGLYPDNEIRRGYSHYTIQGQQSILITKNPNYKDFDSNTSMINFLTKTELRFSTAILLASTDGIYHFVFTGSNTVSIDSDCFENMPMDLRTLFLREYFEIQKKFTPIGVKSWNRQPPPDISEFEYSDFSPFIKTFNKVYDSFSIRDHLLLRTCNYFVKAIMQWDNQIYTEEALANTYFCLEGCLHLIQKKYGDHSRRLNNPMLKEIFISEFRNGEGYFSFIQEAYTKRILFVNPEPDWGADYSPWFSSEDYYEYYRICIDLLNFILIDRKIMNEE